MPTELTNTTVLDRYFGETGDNMSKLAERAGRAPSTITRPLRGERNASMDVALDVERATAGRVSANEFMAICLEAKRRLNGRTLDGSPLAVATVLAGDVA